MSLFDVRGLNERSGNLRSLFYSRRASVAGAIEATFRFSDNLLSYLPSSPIHSIYALSLHLLLFAMATLQRVVISLLLIITAGFLFLAQTASAAKGPLITNKVG